MNLNNLFFSFLILFVSHGFAQTQKQSVVYSRNELSGNTEELELHYIVWGCACPNWITVNDHELFTDDKLIDHSFYLEAGKDSLVLPDDFDPSTDVIKVKGQFYKNKGYPKGFVITEENEQQAKVFRFTEYEVVKYKELNTGLLFDFTAKRTDSGILINAQVVNTTSKEISVLTWSCAGYQDALIYDKSEFSLIGLYCNASHPIIVKIEPQKSYKFTTTFIPSATAEDIKLGFEMNLVDGSVNVSKMKSVDMKTTKGEKVVLWNVARIEPEE